jgi:hypothetical protein
MRYLLIAIAAIALLAAGVVIYEAATDDRTISTFLFGGQTETSPVASLPSDSRHRSFPTTRNGRVEVRFQQAEVRVVRGATASIGVDLFMEGDAVEFGRVQADAVQDSDGTVRVVAYPVGSPLQSGSLTVLLTIPDSTTLHLQGKAGKLAVDGVVGNITCAANHCTTALRDLRGTVRATDTAGTLTLERLVGSGEFTLSGTLLQATMNDAKIRARGEGSVVMEEQFHAADIRLEMGNITAGLRQVADTCWFITQSGNIELQLPERLLPQVDAVPAILGFPDSLGIPLGAPIIARTPQGSISLR